MSGNRGPSSVSSGPTRGFRPVRFKWSVMTINSPGRNAVLTAPAALVTTRVLTPNEPSTRTGNATS